MLTTEIIQKFIKLGQAYSENNPLFDSLLLEISSYDEVNSQSPIVWDIFTEKMSSSDLISLIKGLTIAETHYHWLGGSGGSVIWVFNQFANRESPEVVDEITKWVFDNRWNDYIPLGTNRYSSYEDYQWKNSAEYIERENERKRKKLEAHTKREKSQKEAAKLRRAEKKRIAKEHKKITRKKAAYRKETIQKLTTMDPIERWEQFAKTKSVNIDFYPTEWAKESIAVLKTLSSKIRKALIERLHYKRKGPWKNLREILEDIEKDQQQ